MVRCGVSSSESGNVAAQDKTVSLSAADIALCFNDRGRAPGPHLQTFLQSYVTTVTCPPALVVLWTMPLSTFQGLLSEKFWKNCPVRCAVQALSQLLYPHPLTRATTCLNLKTMVGWWSPQREQWRWSLQQSVWFDKTQKNKVSVCPSSTVLFMRRLVQRMCSYSGRTLQKPNSELRTIISCLCHL